LSAAAVYCFILPIVRHATEPSSAPTLPPIAPAAELLLPATGPAELVDKLAAALALPRELIIAMPPDDLWGATVNGVSLEMVVLLQ
jgi:hypothetical protein